MCGVCGAAAAAGRLAGLDTGRLAHALGIAGSFSAGNLEFLSDGAMTKRLQAGKAAADVELAARLAAEGFTGPRLVLEGPYGIWRYTERRRLEGFTAGLGSRYGLREVHFKKHACCLSMAAAVPQVAVGHDLRLLTLYQELGLAGELFVSGGASPEVFTAVTEQVERLLADPETVRDALHRGHQVHAAAARRNRALLAAFARDHGWEGEPAWAA